MITLYSQKIVPTGWKIVAILESLGLKYETKYLTFEKAEHKAPEFIRFNPNGRIPVIIDHDNGDFLLTESNAIYRYLIERYDKNLTLAYPPGTKEWALVEQWLDIQAADQHPTYFRSVKMTLPNVNTDDYKVALDDTRKEVIRQLQILDDHLKGKDYLVGNKPTIADISFFWFNNSLRRVLGESDHAKEVEQFENFKGWHERIKKLPYVKKTLELKAAALADDN